MSYHRLKLEADKMKDSCLWCTLCVLGAPRTPWRCLDAPNIYQQLNDKLMALKLIMFNLQYKKSVVDVRCTIFLIKIIVFESLIDIKM